jgi:D-sedoheptulose 7-phosphate isomerase
MKMNGDAIGFTRSEVERTLDVLRDTLADESLLAAVERAGAVCTEAIRAGKKVLFAGNGGSAADAQHLAAELVGKLAYDRPAMPAMSLTTDTSILTAIANDYSYEDVFVRQLAALGVKGDVLVGISTSGRSRNLVKAFTAARERGLTCIGMTGATGGDMLPLSDVCIRIPSTDTQKIQEAQIVLGHIFCGLVERAIHPRTR